MVNETDDWANEARRYYFNICGKYGVQVQNVLKKAASLDIETICPLHGPVMRGDIIGHALRLYDAWSCYEPEADGVLIAYASIHGGTAKAAMRLGQILEKKGAREVVVMDLNRSDMSVAVSEAFRLSRVVVAAASYDGDVFPVMHDFLHHLQIKNYQKRRFGIMENGSWAPVSGKVMQGMISHLKDCEIVMPLVSIRSRMHEKDVPQLEALADAMLA